MDKAASVVKCGVLSFLLYYVPTSVLRRRLTNARAALAVASFAAAYRASRLSDADAGSSGALAAAVACGVDPSFPTSSLFVSLCFTRSLKAKPAVHAYLSTHPILLNVVATGLLAPPGFKAPHEHHASYSNFLESFMVLDGVATPDKFRRPPDGVTVARNLVGRRGNIYSWFIRYTGLVALKTLKMYVPLHLLLSLLRGPSKFSLLGLFKSLAKSCAFLTTYVMAAIACLLVHTSCWNKKTPRWQVQLWAWIPGLAVYFEDSRRQVELGLFCLAHGLNATHNHFSGGKPPRWLLGTLLLMASSSVVMSSHAKNPGRVMRIFFDEQ